MTHHAAYARPQRDPSDLSLLSCSFCGKTADHVRFRIAGVAGGMMCAAR